MSEPKFFHPDIITRLRRLVIVLAATPIAVLAVFGGALVLPGLIWGLQECRGGRAILASDYGPQVETKIDLVGRERVPIWNGPLTFMPVRVAFPTNVGEGQFEVAVTDHETGDVTISRHGYVIGSGGAHYILVTDDTALFATSEAGYYRDVDYPDWVNDLFGTYYEITDRLTCLI